MKKLLLFLVLVLAVGVGLIYAGVMPREFYVWVDSFAPPVVSDALYSMGGIHEDTEDLVPQSQSDLSGGAAAAGVSSTPSFSAAELSEGEYSSITQSVVDGVRAQKEGIQIPLALPEGDDDAITAYFLREVEAAIDMMRRDTPEIFWVSLGSYNIEWNGSRESKEGTLTVYLDYCHSAGEVEDLENKINSVIDELVSGAPESPADAVAFFHDWIVENTVYASDIAAAGSTMQGYEYGFNVDGVFLRGKAVCEGYSKAFKILCDRAGIPCEIVFGLANEENHSWNYVKLEGKWYLVDCTWDDPVGAGDILRHDYFLKGGESEIDGKTISEIYINDHAGYPQLHRLEYLK